MPYDVSVTRRNPIALNEWTRFLATSPDFERVDERVVDTPSGDRISIPTRAGARWRGDPSTQVEWARGTLRVSNPRDEDFRVLHHLATVFGGQVVGEEGEVYEPDE